MVVDTNPDDGYIGTMMTNTNNTDAALAAKIIAVAATVPADKRWGDRKVFIADAARACGFRHLNAFKSILIRLNSAGLVELCRWDFAHRDVARADESETRYLNAEFHFIVVAA